jgi:hypothetical protein
MYMYVLAKYIKYDPVKTLYYLAISLDEFKRKTSKSPMKYYIHRYKHIKIIYKVYHTLISDVGVGERKTNEVFFSLSLSCRNSSFTIPPLRPLMPVRLIRSFSLNFVSFISSLNITNILSSTISGSSVQYGPIEYGVINYVLIALSILIGSLLIGAVTSTWMNAVVICSILIMLVIVCAPD